MQIPLVDLKAQYRALRAELDAAMAAVIADAAFVGNVSNPYVRKFADEFAAFVGVKHCVPCANGTDAIEIMLQAAGVGPGDEVIVPAMSWIATSEAVTTVGAKPVFADIDAGTYTLSPVDFARKITPRTKAVIPVHLYGQPAAMDAIMATARKHRLFVLEDCAQAHGAKDRGQPVGTFGDAAAFSFFPGKNLGAYGDAGGMVTNNEALAMHARMISQHGQGKGKHDHQIEGRNSRLDGLQAAVLSVKLKYLAAGNERRRAHALTYRRLLGGMNVVLQETPADDYHVYHLLTVQVPRRDEVAAQMQAAGIGVTIQYPRALPFLAAYAAREHVREDFPVAANLADRVLSLPMYPELENEQIAYVVDTLRRILAR